MILTFALGPGRACAVSHDSPFGFPEAQSAVRAKMLAGFRFICPGFGLSPEVPLNPEPGSGRRFVWTTRAKSYASTSLGASLEAFPVPNGRPRALFVKISHPRIRVSGRYRVSRVKAEEPAGRASEPAGGRVAQLALLLGRELRARREYPELLEMRPFSCPRAARSGVRALPSSACLSWATRPDGCGDAPQCSPASKCCRQVQKCMPTVNITAWLMKSYVPLAVCPEKRQAWRMACCRSTVCAGPYPNWYATSKSKRLPLNPAPMLKKCRSRSAASGRVIGVRDRVLVKDIAGAHVPAVVEIPRHAELVHPARLPIERHEDVLLHGIRRSGGSAGWWSCRSCSNPCNQHQTPGSIWAWAGTKRQAQSSRGTQSPPARPASWPGKAHAGLLLEFRVAVQSEPSPSCGKLRPARLARCGCHSRPRL